MLYAEQNWTICDHLKVNGLLLGLKRGYIKYAAFSFFGFSRVKSDQWIHDKWGKGVKIGEKNVLNMSLFELRKVLLSPYHIELGLMKPWTIIVTVSIT